MDTHALIKEATNGDKAALENIAASIQKDVYYLALRMLVNPDDAQDATQEILIKVITNLASFKFESKFTTWVYRIAVNHLITEKKILSKDPNLTFDLFKQDLESDLQEPHGIQDEPSYPILLNELRISCTMAMLLCLNSAHRIAYILGYILELEHAEASEILSISKDNFRQQVSRAKSKVLAFTSQNCGFVNDQAKCSCPKKITGAVERKRIHPDKIFFTSNNQHTYDEIKERVSETQQELKALTLQKAIKPHTSFIELGGIIESLVAQGLKANRPFD